jgi:hypothetical protein
MFFSSIFPWPFLGSRAFLVELLMRRALMLQLMGNLEAAGGGANGEPTAGLVNWYLK